MSAFPFRVESGLQMILRLTNKPDLNNFYPKLFKLGPNHGDIIEVYSEDDTSCLINDIIYESLIPLELGGKQSGVILFKTDGRINLAILKKVIKNKLASRVDDSSLLDNYLQNILSNLFIFEIYNSTQLHASINSLGTVLIDHPNISLIVFDTLTAFYWSEQSFKITKMDMYLKHMHKVIQKTLVDYKVVILYTRPQYFSSNKDKIGKLEAHCENPVLENLNYRIQVVFNDDGPHHATVQTIKGLYKRSFQIQDNSIVWC